MYWQKQISFTKQQTEKQPEEQKSSGLFSSVILLYDRHISVGCRVLNRGRIVESIKKHAAE